MMPIISIKILKGRTREQKKELVEQMTACVEKTIGAKKENISIIIEEMDQENYAQAGILKIDEV